MKKAGLWMGMLLIGSATIGMTAEPETQTSNQEWICTFEDMESGVVPQGWNIAENAKPGTQTTLATWQVVEMEGVPSGKKTFALTKTDNPNPTYNLAIQENGMYQDMEIEVKLKAMTGKLDQGGGPDLARAR